MVDPWSSTSSYPLSFNDNEILQCPEESPEEQHLRLRVVFVPGSVEGRSEGPGDGEGETEWRRRRKGEIWWEVEVEGEVEVEVEMEMEAEVTWKMEVETGT
uniref:Uncharacterized protein n=1 Tax=Fagus sylvatica TaxID=28930 RepID=A0A2N9HL98_FAGSY